MPYADFIKYFKKLELHLHLYGSFPLSFLQTLVVDKKSATEYQNLLISRKELLKGASYHDSFKCFLPIYKLVNTAFKLECGVLALGKQLLNDGVCYVEVRTALQDFGNGVEEYLTAVLKGISACPTALKIKIILSLRRNTNLALAQKTVDLAIKYKTCGVVGLDVSGNSTIGKTSDIYSELKRAKQAGLYLTMHIGESSEEIDTPEKQCAQLEDLKQLHPDRIGHGVFLAPLSVKWVLEHPTVPVEVCLTSSVLAGMVSHYRKHPWLTRYIKNKHPIIICADDTTVFATTLTDEYCKLLTVQGFKIEQFQNIINSAIQFAFLSSEEKAILCQRVTQPQVKSNIAKCRL